MRFSGMFDQLAKVLSQSQLGDITSDHKQEAIAGYHGSNFIAINAVLRQVGRSSVFVYDDSGELANKQIRKANRQRDPWSYVKAMSGHENSKLVKDHPLIQLLNRPNKSQTGAHFRMEAVLQLRLHGSALIWNRFNVSQTRVVERYVIPHAFADPVRPGVDRRAPNGGLKIRPLGASAYYADEALTASPIFAFSNEVIPIERLSVARYPHPAFKSDGNSLTNAISQWIDSVSHINKSRMKFYGLGPDGRVIITAQSEDGSELSDTQLTDIENKLNRKFSEMNLPVIVVRGSHSLASQKSADDMGFDNAFDQLSRYIFMAHGVSKSLLGDQDSMTYGSIAASLFSANVLSIQPDLDLLADEDTLDLADQYPGDISVEYIVPPIEDPETQDKRLETDARTGTITVREYRTARNREPYGNELDDWILTSQGPVDPKTLIAQSKQQQQPQQQPGMGMGAAGGFGGGFGGGSPSFGGFGGGGQPESSPFGKHEPQDWQFSNPTQISKSLAYNSVDIPLVGVDYGALVDRKSKKIKHETLKACRILEKSGCKVSVVTAYDPSEIEKELIGLGLNLPVNSGDATAILYDSSEGSTGNVLDGLRAIIETLPEPQRQQLAAALELKKLGYICLKPSEQAAAAIVQFARDRIDVNHLSLHGYESEPHVTLLYGFVGERAEDVVSTVKRLPIVDVLVGDMVAFPTKDGSVAVVLKVSSETLMSMRKSICAEVPHAAQEYEYCPHITLGYVKPEFASLYSGPSELSGWSVELSQAKVCGPSPDCEVFLVPLRGMIARELDGLNQIEASADESFIEKAATFVDEIAKAKIGISAKLVEENLVAAGLCVVASDTGRVLMLQRALDDSDPASGCWEFPGGHIEEGERPIEAAKREWSEETGCIVPRGKQVATWTSGIYQGFVWLIAREASVLINPGSDRKVLNPDDPDQDNVEVVAWFRPSQLLENGSLRQELKASLGQVIDAVRSSGCTESQVKTRVVDWAKRLDTLQARKNPITKAAVLPMIKPAVPEPVKDANVDLQVFNFVRSINKQLKDGHFASKVGDEPEVEQETKANKDEQVSLQRPVLSEADAKKKLFEVRRDSQVSAIMRQVNDSDLSPTQKQLVEAVITDSLNRMSRRAIETLDEGVHEIMFHRSAKDLGQVLGVDSPVPVAYVRGGEHGGVLHLVAGPANDDTTAIYLHGFGHAVDGAANVSDSEEWKSAWSEELQNQALSDHAASNPVEGFAEFARFAWSGVPKQSVVDQFPSCSAVFEQFKLL